MDTGKLSRHPDPENNAGVTCDKPYIPSRGVAMLLVASMLVKPEVSTGQVSCLGLKMDLP